MKKEKRKFTIKRWFKHWCAYQLTALNLDCWKFKYLIHDLDKPILNLVFSNSKVTELHRKFSNHHVDIEKGVFRDLDATLIDFQCSGLTKPDAKLDARETLLKIYINKLRPDQLEIGLDRLKNLNL